MGGALVDLAKEIGTHDLTTEQIVQDTAAVETELFVKSLPVVGTAATIVDPILHQAELPGIGDVAADIGRAAASDAQSELPKDEHALEDSPTRETRETVNIAESRLTLYGWSASLHRLGMPAGEHS